MTETKKQSNLLNLDSRVDPIKPNNLNDINAVRDSMQNLGRYKGVSAGFYERNFMELPLKNEIVSYQKEKGLKEDGLLNPGGETQNALNNDLKQEKKLDNFSSKPLSLLGNILTLHEVRRTYHQMKRNYYDMKEDNTKGADAYFHCKANFEPSRRSAEGETSAYAFGTLKELSQKCSKGDIC